MADAESDPRQRLLDAGLRLFADRGYAGTSVQDVIDAAGVTKPVLYYYFESKGGLFQALVDQAVEERLRLMEKAAPIGKPTVEALTDILTALTDFARREPDLLRLSFAVAFAAPGEMPEGFRLPPKVLDSFRFIHELIATGRDNGALNADYSVEELAESYFKLVQHSVAVSVLSARTPPPGLPPMPPPTRPERAIELYLYGAAPKKPAARLSRTAKPLLVAASILLFPLAASAQAIKERSPTDPGVSTNVVPTAPAAAMTNSAPIAATTTNQPTTSATTDMTTVTTLPNSGPTTAEVRPVPPAVRASHPELATVSPIEANAHNPRAIDLQTCFQLTAVRDDSLKISMKDIEIARAELSESIANLWPTFTVTNQQQFLHYTGGNATSSFPTVTSTSTGAGGTGTGGTGTTGSGTTGTPVTGFTEVANNRDYVSQSNVTMSYTVFDGAQNYNRVGASSELVKARRETLARDYQTIYMDVAQGFYNVLQYQGDLVVQKDLIAALAARVDDLTQRVKLGRSRPSEMLQAQTDLANARVTAEAAAGLVQCGAGNRGVLHRNPLRAFCPKGHGRVSERAAAGVLPAAKWRAARRAFAGRQPPSGRAESVRGQGRNFPDRHGERRLPLSAGSCLQQRGRDDVAANLDADLRRRTDPGADPRES